MCLVPENLTASVARPDGRVQLPILTYIVSRYIVRRYSTGNRRMKELSPAVFHILLSLVDGDRHGYGMMQEIEERTAGRARIGPGTLYGALKRLREEGLIEEREGEDDADGERRRYYHLTAAGRKAARNEAQRLQELVASAHAKRLLSRARLA